MGLGQSKMALEASPIKYQTMEGSSERDYVSDGVSDFFDFLYLVSWQSSGLFLVTDTL
jgi:hypothetical protein